MIQIVIIFKRQTCLAKRTHQIVGKELILKSSSVAAFDAAGTLLKFAPSQIAGYELCKIEVKCEEMTVTLHQFMTSFFKSTLIYSGPIELIAAKIERTQSFSRMILNFCDLSRALLVKFRLTRKCANSLHTCMQAYTAKVKAYYYYKM